MISYFKNTHILQQKFGFSLTEINNMVPWHLDIRMEMILMDQEKEKEEASRRSGKKW